MERLRRWLADWKGPPAIANPNRHEFDYVPIEIRMKALDDWYARIAGRLLKMIALALIIFILATIAQVVLQ